MKKPFSLIFIKLNSMIVETVHYTSTPDHKQHVCVQTVGLGELLNSKHYFVVRSLTSHHAFGWFRTKSPGAAPFETIAPRTRSPQKVFRGRLWPTSRENERLHTTVASHAAGRQRARTVRGAARGRFECRRRRRGSPRTDGRRPRRGRYYR